MGSKPKGEQQVAEYYLSIHLAWAHHIDEVKALYYNEKLFWEGSEVVNAVLDINKPDLMGGIKKEGGLKGKVHLLFGADDQVLPGELAARLGDTPDNLPGFRGVFTTYFIGGGSGGSILPPGLEMPPASAGAGFYWSANSPYLRYPWMTGVRAPKGLDPTIALIPNECDTSENEVSNGGLIFVRKIDFSSAGNLPGFEPFNNRITSYDPRSGLFSAFGQYRYASPGRYNSLEGGYLLRYDGQGNIVDSTPLFIEVFEVNIPDLNPYDGIDTSVIIPWGWDVPDFDGRSAFDAVVGHPTLITVNAWAYDTSDPCGTWVLDLAFLGPQVNPTAPYGYLFKAKHGPTLTGPDGIPLVSGINANGDTPTERWASLRAVTLDVGIGLRSRLVRVGNFMLGETVVPDLVHPYGYRVHICKWHAINNSAGVLASVDVTEDRSYFHVSASTYFPLVFISDAFDPFSAGSFVDRHHNFWIRGRVNGLMKFINTQVVNLLTLAQTMPPGAVENLDHAYIFGVDGGMYFNAVGEIARDDVYVTDSYTVYREPVPGTVVPEFLTFSENMPFDQRGPLQVLPNGELYDRNGSVMKLEPFKWISTGGPLDANPAHIIYECLTDTDFGIGHPPDRIDIASFERCARTLYAEQLGLSFMWSGQSDIAAIVNDTLAHIDGTYGVDPETDKIYLQLIRDDYDLSNTPHIDEDSCVVTKYQRKTLADTSNELVVTWTSPLTEQEETIAVHDLANYAAQGQIVSSSRNYYGIRCAKLAARIAMRELNKASQPLASAEISVMRSAWNWRSGDVVRLSYSEYGLSELPMRVTRISYGRPGDMVISVSLVEDVFAMPTRAFVDVANSDWTEVTVPPPPITFFLAAEAPYYLYAKQYGDAAAAAVIEPETFATLLLAEPGGSVIAAEVYHEASDPLGGVSYQTIGDFPIAGHAVLSSPLVAEAVTSIAGFAGFTGNVTPVIGSLVWVGDVGTNSELLMVSAVSGSALTVNRGVLDTVPRAWPADTPIWFLDPQADYLDDTSRSDGASVWYKALTRTASGQLELGDADAHFFTIESRITAPYRPANVLLNGAPWPSSITTLDGVITISWAIRNRLLETAIVLPWTAAGTSPEAGTTTAVQIHNAVTDELLYSDLTLTGSSVDVTLLFNGIIRVVVFSMRDGDASYTAFIHELNFTGPSDTMITEDGDTMITEDGDTMTTE